MFRDILIQQKRDFEEKMADRYIVRKVTTPTAENDLVIVILGPRRAGKSFLAMHVINLRTSFGYINFDDERLVGLQNYDELLTIVDSLFDNPTSLLLDEIQNVEGWELLLNRLQRQGRRLVVTGSNAHMLSSELATHLTGRHIPLTLFPFSFSEYADAKSKHQPVTELENKELLYTYLQNGGYPEPVLKDVDRKNYLSTLLESILYKDIIKRFKIRSMEAIEDLTRYLLSNVGSEYSNNTLAEVTKCKSSNTIEKYLRFLEIAFVFFSLKRFSYKVKEQAKANKKIYCIDNGFVSARAFAVSEGIGRLAENAVAIRLHKQELDKECEVFFWKNIQQHEVDFVVVKNRKVDQLIQVCWNIENPTTKDREVRALVNAGSELNCSNLIVLNESLLKSESVEWFGKTATIQFVPIWKWMME